MDILSKIAEPFNPATIKWRVGSVSKDKTKAMALAYVDARIVMVRLDDVVGANNWQDKYFETNSGRIMCELSVRIHGEWITKTDGAGDTGTEGEKGAISDAFKRAAVKFGIGRYLYAFPNSWVAIDQYKKIVKPPQLPSWAQPAQKTISSMQAAYQNAETIMGTKAAIEQGDAQTMRAVYLELSQDEQNALWVAPSKGGIWTTEERTYMQNNMSGDK